MAQSRRQTQHGVYGSHSAQARDASQRVVSDAARTLLDLAWSAHETARLVQLQADRNDAAADRFYAQAAWFDTNRRNETVIAPDGQVVSTGTYLRTVGDDYRRAAEVARQNAAAHHERGNHHYTQAHAHDSRVKSLMVEANKAREETRAKAQQQKPDTAQPPTAGQPQEVAQLDQTSQRQVGEAQAAEEQRTAPTEATAERNGGRTRRQP